MKKLITIVILIASMMIYTACSRRMDNRTAKNQNNGADAGKNKTEGYFYHHSEENLNSDSTKVKKNVNN